MTFKENMFIALCVGITSFLVKHQWYDWATIAGMWTLIMANQLKK